MQLIEASRQAKHRHRNFYRAPDNQKPTITTDRDNDRRTQVLLLLKPKQISVQGNLLMRKYRVSNGSLLLNSNNSCHCAKTPGHMYKQRTDEEELERSFEALITAVEPTVVRPVVGEPAGDMHLWPSSGRVDDRTSPTAGRMCRQCCRRTTRWRHKASPWMTSLLASARCCLRRWRSHVRAHAAQVRVQPGAKSGTMHCLDCLISPHYSEPGTLNNGSDYQRHPSTIAGLPLQKTAELRSICCVLRQLQIK